MHSAKSPPENQSTFPTWGGEPHDTRKARAYLRAGRPHELPYYLSAVVGEQLNPRKQAQECDIRVTTSPPLRCTMMVID